MKIEIKDKENISKALQIILPTLKFISNKYLDSESIIQIEKLDQMLNKSKSKKFLSTFIHDPAFSQLVYSVISKYLSKFEYIESDAVAILEHNKSIDLDYLCAMIINEMEGIPYNYCLSMSIPNEIAHAFDVNQTYKFGTSISISQLRNIKDEFSLDEPPHKNMTLLGSLFDMRTQQEIDEECYIQLFDEGYTGYFTKFNVEINAIQKIKSFFGLLFAFRTIEKRTSIFPSSARRKIDVYKLNNEKKLTFENTLELDLQSSRLLSDLKLFTAYYDSKEQEFATQYLKHVLSNVSTAFSAEESGNRILLGASWLFDSYSSENIVLAYVQLMICLEILLGDKESSSKIGLNELLRNRCAYLIGSDYSQRQEILEEFSKIYDVRSKIVHSGKNHINTQDERLFWKLQWYCARIIQEEIYLIRNQKTNARSIT